MHRLQQLCYVGSLFAEHRLSSCDAWAQPHHGMWDLHGPGIKLVSSALAGGLSTTGSPGQSMFSNITHAPTKNYMRCWFPEPTFSSHVTTEYCSRQVGNHCEARILQMDPAVTWIKSPDKSFWDRKQWWAGASLLHISYSNSLCCCCCYVALVVSDSVRPHRRQPTRRPVPGILQARPLEWVAISFSNA